MHAATRAKPSEKVKSRRQNLTTNEQKLWIGNIANLWPC